MTIRARKSDYCEDWHVEQEIPCINGLSAWFVIATAEEADEASMGYTDGIFGTAEDRASRIVDALEHAASTTNDSVARRQQNVVPEITVPLCEAFRVIGIDISEADLKKFERDLYERGLNVAPRAIAEPI